MLHAAEPVTIPVAFPGAQGYGATATGGRGGGVCHVTNLNDSGKGSFRDAVSQGHRIVVFDVGGIINLLSPVVVGSNITIAGQTATGQGISTSGNTVYLNGKDGGNSNIIIRFMRFRQGYTETGTGYSLGLKPAHTVILDHCSIELGNWQTLSITYNHRTGEKPTDITVQNCIIGASLSNQLGVLVWEPVNLTFHHNLFIDNGGRDPKAWGNMQVINDVIYNFNLGIYSEGQEQCDLIGNYHINGPDTRSSMNCGINLRSATVGTYYVSGNYWDNNRDGILNGKPLIPSKEITFLPNISPTPLCKPAVPVTIDTAQEAYYKVISEAGTSLVRDPFDTELIRQASSLGRLGPGVPGLYMLHKTPRGPKGEITGISKEPPGGNPIPPWSIDGGTAPIDTDGDGMPDDWECATGSNPTVPDGNTPMNDGYTRLEHYLNWMAEPHMRLAGTAPVSIDLAQYSAGVDPATSTFVITDTTGGTATLQPDKHSIEFTPTVPFTGLGSFNFKVTARDGATLSRKVGILGSH